MEPLASVGGLGYLGLTSADLDGWRSLAVDVLGMEVGTGTTDDRLRLKMDDNVYRLEVARGTGEGVTHLGWEVRDRRTLRAVAAQLDAHGFGWKEATVEECDAREVGSMIRTEDPDGRSVEVYVGGRREDTRPFRSALGTSYITGDTGLGHVVLWVADHEAALRFYTEALGLAVTDFLRAHIDGAFCGSTERHHSVALFRKEGVPVHCDHLMVEVDSLTALGQAHDRALARPGTLARSLGQHWNDRATSFYVHTPSGLEIEVAWGALLVDRTTWRSSLGNGEISFWGHHALDRDQAQKFRATTWIADLRLVGDDDAEEATAR